MATYGNRITELRDLLKQATTGADERIVKTLTTCIDKYSDLRQRALDDLVDFIARASAGNLGTQARWESRIASVRAEYNRLFGDSVKDLMLPPPVQLFWFAALQAEDAFFERLAKVKTPQLLDDILKHQDGLSKLIAELQDGWTFLLSSDQALQTDEMRAVQQLDEMVQKILSEVDGWHREMIDNLARAEEAVKKAAANVKDKAKEALGRAAPVAGAALEMLKQYVIDTIKPGGLDSDFDTQLEAVRQQAELRKQLLVERTRYYRSLVQTYQSLLSAEKGGVLSMFKKTRDEVDRYLSTSDIAKAKVWFDQAKGQLSDWASGLPTSRQKDDATSFRNDVVQHIESDWKITEDLDKNFRERFSGVFIVPLKTETIESLAEKYLFKQHLQTIAGRGAAAKLDDYRNKLPAHTEGMERALRPLEDAMSSLPPEVQDLAKLKNREFQAYVRERTKNHIETLLPVIDELKKMLEPSSLEKDFNREELEGMLR